MFIIQGIAEFSEQDMHLGEEFEKTLINEGFGVEKHYDFTPIAKLVLKFGVMDNGIRKPETYYHLH